MIGDSGDESFSGLLTAAPCSNLSSLESSASLP